MIGEPLGPASTQYSEWEGTSAADDCDPDGDRQDLTTWFRQHGPEEIRDRQVLGFNLYWEKCWNFLTLYLADFVGSIVDHANENGGQIAVIEYTVDDERTVEEILAKHF